MGRGCRCIAPIPAHTARAQHKYQLTYCHAPLCAGAKSSRRKKVDIRFHAETALNEAWKQREQVDDLRRLGARCVQHVKGACVARNMPVLCWVRGWVEGGNVVGTLCRAR